MAKFEKSAGQSSKGWDGRAGQHVVSVGSDIEITLAGSDADALTVSSSDPTMCTVHERKSASKHIGGGRVFVVTALRAGDCKIEARTKGRQVMAWFQAHITATKNPFKLVFFPGERTLGEVTMGTIYVVGGNGERFRAAGGAPAAYKDRGGHTSDPTPPGRYVLGAQHHVTTGTWPRSAIPYGARIRILLDKRIEFETPGKTWLPVTGPNGVVVKYMKEFAARDGQTRTWQECDAELRELLIDPKTGWLRTAYWDLNDFGRWGWNMTKNGAITPFYIHTTPIDEMLTAEGKPVALSNSHGCVHILPAERDKMISLGYLKRGVEFEVRRYSEVGPP